MIRRQHNDKKKERKNGLRRLPVLSRWSILNGSTTSLIRENSYIEGLLNNPEKTLRRNDEKTVSPAGISYITIKLNLLNLKCFKETLICG